LIEQLAVEQDALGDDVPERQLQRKTTIERINALSDEEWGDLVEQLRANNPPALQIPVSGANGEPSSPQLSPRSPEDIDRALQEAFFEMKVARDARKAEEKKREEEERAVDAQLARQATEQKKRWRAGLARVAGIRWKITNMLAKTKKD
jgi:hypothetical protein